MLVTRLLEIVGMCLVVVGLGLAWLPLGVVAAGAFCLLVSVGLWSDR